MKRPFLFLLMLFCNGANAQIILNGYKCHFNKDQWPFQMAEMYRGNDTFRSESYGKDIQFSKSDPTGIKDALDLCFDGGRMKYHKTRDGLYISTGASADSSVFYYKIYIPNQTVSVSIRSNKNDADLRKQSEWLLAYVRRNLKAKRENYLINERHQTCSDPSNPSN
jgi:hypothetical protein